MAAFPAKRDMKIDSGHFMMSEEKKLEKQMML